MCDNHVGVLPNGQPVKLHRRDVVRGLWAGSMVLFAGGATSCTTNPATGRTQLAFMSDSQLVSMASQAWSQTKSELPISTDRKANERLTRIGHKIKAVASKRTPSLQNADWEFVVFDTEDKNAFVLPGGKVGFYKGLLDYSDNDDQVAAVLGHEVGHVEGRHSNERMSQQTLGQAGLLATGLAASMSDLSSEQQQMVMIQ